MKIKPIFAWYDFWVGLFWDGAKRRLYIFPVPMLGLVLDFSKPEKCPDVLHFQIATLQGKGPRVAVHGGSCACPECIWDLTSRIQELEKNSHAPVDLRPAIKEEIAKALFDKGL